MLWCIPGRLWGRRLEIEKPAPGDVEQGDFSKLFQSTESPLLCSTRHLWLWDVPAGLGDCAPAQREQALHVQGKLTCWHSLPRSFSPLPAPAWDRGLLSPCACVSTGMPWKRAGTVFLTLSFCWYCSINDSQCRIDFNCAYSWLSIRKIEINSF